MLATTIRQMMFGAVVEEKTLTQKQAFFWRIVLGHWNGELSEFQKSARFIMEGRESVDVDCFSDEPGSAISSFSGELIECE